MSTPIQQAMELASSLFDKAGELHQERERLLEIARFEADDTIAICAADLALRINLEAKRLLQEAAEVWKPKS
jgi:hypothetical protein